MRAERKDEGSRRTDLIENLHRDGRLVLRQKPAVVFGDGVGRPGWRSWPAIGEGGGVAGRFRLTFSESEKDRRGSSRPGC